MRGWPFALALLALAAGCNRSATPSAGACDGARLREGIEQLTEAQAVVRPLVAAQTIEAACPTTPDTLRAFLDLVQSTVRGTRPMGQVRPSDEERDRLFAAACPIEESARKQALAASPDVLAQTVFQACDLGRFGVIERADVNPFFGGTPAVWSLHAWLLEVGVSPEQARPLTKALLLFEAWHLNRVGLRPGGTLPRAEQAAAVPPSAEVIYVGPDVIAFRGNVISEFDQELVPGAVESLARKALLAVPGEGQATLVVVADADTAPEHLLAVLDAAASSGRFAVLGFAVMTKSETAPYGLLEFSWAPTAEGSGPRANLSSAERIDELVQHVVDLGDGATLSP